MVTQSGVAGGSEGARLRAHDRLVSSVAVAIALVATATFSSAVAGERTQRFALEIAVLASRSQRLLVADLTPAQHRRLQAKIGSALGVLPLLARECLEEQRKVHERSLLARLQRLSSAYAHGQIAALHAGLDRLSRSYPVDLRGLLPLPESSGAVRTGRALYDRLCMGCHAYPDSQSPAPAPDLFASARALSAAGLVVILLDGVRGTHSTTLVNPLSNQDIADLAAYLRHGTESGR